MPCEELSVTEAVMAEASEMGTVSTFSFLSNQHFPGTDNDLQCITNHNVSHPGLVGLGWKVEVQFLIPMPPGARGAADGTSFAFRKHFMSRLRPLWLTQQFVTLT